MLRLQPRWFALALLLTPGSLTEPLAAQDDGREGIPYVSVYHGAKGRSTIVVGNEYAGHRRDRRFVLSEGDSLCVEVGNAHPGFYTYTLDSVVISTTDAAPDLSTLADIVSKLIENQNVAGMPLTPPPGTVEAYAAELDNLATDIKRVRAAIERSDEPEPLPPLFQRNAAPGEPRGFSYVARFINDSLPEGKGRFRSTTLSADIEAGYQAARTAAGQNSTELLLAEALRAHGRTLAKTVSDIRAVYVDTEPTQICRRMGSAERMEFRLNARSRDSTRTARRETGTLVTLRAYRRNPRPWLELIPIGMTAYSPKAPRYELVRDTVRVRSESSFAFRPGALALANPLVFGETSDWALGGGIGFGIGGEDKVLSDYLGAVMLSYRDRFRFGVGAGFATRKSHLEGGILPGSPRPADAKTIDDLLEDEREPSWFLLFDFTGLKLPVIPR